MKLLCIYSASSAFIEKDKMYEVVSYDKTKVKLINDKGMIMGYPYSWFENTEEEIRNEKLEKLFKKIMFKVGDNVSILIDIDEEPEDEYSFSIKSGEVGTIKSIVNPNANPSEIIYRISFPDENGKKRKIQLVALGIKKI